MDYQGTNDLREKLILDYEKLYYRIYELKLTQKLHQNEKHTTLIKDYQGKLGYIDYLFMYLFDISIYKFINLKNIEEKVKTYTKTRFSKEFHENWQEVYENNSYQSIKF